MDNHTLSFETELISCPGCRKEQSTRTTDRGWCRCGWFCWAKTKEEIKAAFDFHVKWTTDNTARLAAENEARKQERDREQERAERVAASIGPIVVGLGKRS